MNPVVIFAYNRLEALVKTWNSLTRCAGFESRPIFIYHDGLKNNSNIEKWNAVRDFLNLLNQDSNVTVITRNENLGLAVSVFRGVTDILEKYGTVIVLEDDLIFSNDFLQFMDDALAVYINRGDIYSVSGFSHFNNMEISEDVFLFPRPNSWGWATWREKWTGFKLDAIPKSVLADYRRLKQFQSGGVDLPWMLRNQFRGNINSWAIQWAFYHFQVHGLCVYPKCSKVENIGFGEDATHTKKLKSSVGKRCDTVLIPKSEIVRDTIIIEKYRGFFRLGMFTRLLNSIWLSCLRINCVISI